MIIDWLRSLLWGKDSCLSSEDGIEIHQWYRCSGCNCLKEEENILFLDDDGIAHCNGCKTWECEEYGKDHIAYPTIVIEVRR